MRMGCSSTSGVELGMRSDRLQRSLPVMSLTLWFLLSRRLEDQESLTDRGATEVDGDELGRFLSKGVTVRTRNGYAASWRAWVVFIGKESSDARRRVVFLEGMKSDTERAVRLALFFQERYENGV